ncbi:SAM--benzoic acid carboxyl methyltransferase [Listeria monocytogenes]|nr:SAM--benzoic acid carboxyl methyltransferase [Listeria monocytogenes]
MGDDDYCPQCFECDGECVNGENETLVCESCGHVYTDEGWDEKNDKEIAEYVAFLKGLSEVSE